MLVFMFVQMRRWHLSHYVSRCRALQSTRLSSRKDRDAVKIGGLLAGSGVGSDGCKTRELCGGWLVLAPTIPLRLEESITETLGVETLLLSSFSLS